MKLIVWLLTETIKKQIWQTEQELLKTGCVFFKPIPYLRTYVITNLMLYLSSSRASMSFLVILIIYTNLAPIMFHAAVPTGAGKTLPQLATILTMEGLLQSIPFEIWLFIHLAIFIRFYINIIENYYLFDFLLLFHQCSEPQLPLLISFQKLSWLGSLWID